MSEYQLRIVVCVWSNWPASAMALWFTPGSSFVPPESSCIRAFGEQVDEAPFPSSESKGGTSSCSPSQSQPRCCRLSEVRCRFRSSNQRKNLQIATRWRPIMFPNWKCATFELDRVWSLCLLGPGDLWKGRPETSSLFGWLVRFVASSWRSTAG